MKRRAQFGADAFADAAAKRLSDQATLELGTVFAAHPEHVDRSDLGVLLLLSPATRAEILLAGINESWRMTSTEKGGAR